jgi:N-acetylglutamate synthase-like GNAT family acetyltransferase
MTTEKTIRSTAPFTEKGFYLSEFRGRTLGFVVPRGEGAATVGFESVLRELEANSTGVVVISPDPEAATGDLLTPLVSSEGDRLEGAVWRTLQRSARVGMAVDAPQGFEATCRALAVRLGVAKLIWVDPQGGLLRSKGNRRSFVDLEELADLVGGQTHGDRTPLLREIDAALRGGIPSVNLCTPDGLWDEIFTYAGSGTLFTRERYVTVRRLCVDDFSAAHDLVARGVTEGYLAPRSDEEIDRVFANGIGAFVEGRHLAGIGALFPLEAANCGEIASLYTLTRFLGEGVGGHLVAALLERARSLGYDFVFACTTTDQVAGFFERQGFHRVPAEKIPDDKWRNYDPLRRPRVRSLLRDLSVPDPGG